MPDDSAAKAGSVGDLSQGLERERRKRANLRFLLAPLIGRFPGDPLQDFFDRDDWLDRRPPHLAPPEPWPPNQDCLNGCRERYETAKKVADLEPDLYLRQQMYGFAGFDFADCLADCWGQLREDDRPDTHEAPR